MLPKTLSAADFDAALPKLGTLALNTIKIAREVLVDGKTQNEVAIDHRMSRQRVHGIVQRFMASYEGIPADWRRVEVWLPPEKARRVIVDAMRERNMRRHLNNMKARQQGG